METFANSPAKENDSSFTALRKRMVQQVAKGTTLLLRLQKLRRFLLVHVWLRGSSALGGEVFSRFWLEPTALSQISGATW
jgi:hypothetical protein